MDLGREPLVKISKYFHGAGRSIEVRLPNPVTQIEKMGVKTLSRLQRPAKVSVNYLGFND